MSCCEFIWLRASGKAFLRSCRESSSLLEPAYRDVTPGNLRQGAALSSRESLLESLAQVRFEQCERIFVSPKYRQNMSAQNGNQILQRLCAYSLIKVPRGLSA